jgi:hypothetical protein
MGWQVQGWPRFVVRRGQLVLADDEITARPGEGEWLRRVGTAKNEWDQAGHASYDRSHAEL